MPVKGSKSMNPVAAVQQCYPLKDHIHWLSSTLFCRLPTKSSGLQISMASTNMFYIILHAMPSCWTRGSELSKTPGSSNSERSPMFVCSFYMSYSATNAICGLFQQLVQRITMSVVFCDSKV
uniref:Uncharacterized protein n=1 Tax=Physcomitrium patens TaxID=3218 RepID=A9TQI1_PHYPA|nr:hypothetical protein PHYPA_004981 [Physcomitrium patens]